MDDPVQTRARHFSTAQTLLHRANTGDLDKSIDQALALIGKAMQACRAYVFLADDYASLRNTHEWCADGVQSMKTQLQNVPFSDGDTFWQMFHRTGILIVPDLFKIDPDSKLRQVLDGQDIIALIATGLWRDGRIVGLVGLDFTKGPRHFRPDEDLALRAFAATLSLAVQNRDHARALYRVETDLRAAQIRLSAAVLRAPRLLVETDGDGILTGFFQSDPLTFALNPQEVIGSPPEHVLPPHVAAIVRKAILEVDQLGRSETHTYSLMLGTQERWFSLVAMLRDPDKAEGRSGYLFLVTDISETRRQDTQIRQLVRVAELSTNLILLTDKQGHITWANPTSHARTGYPNGEMLGCYPMDILHLDADGQGVVEEMTQILARGQSVNKEVKAKSRRGVDYWLDLNIQPLRGADGDVQGFMVVGVDITSHKLAEARVLRDRMRTLDASSEGFAIFWPDGRVAFMNAELRKLLNLPRDLDQSSLLWTDVVHPEFAERLIAILPDLMGSGYWTDEVTINRDSRGEVHLDLSLTVQDDGSIFLVVRDITARKQSEAERADLHAQLQLSQSRHVMTHMAAGLAHDFANLLSVITGSVLVLNEQVPPTAQPALTRIRHASAQAQDLVSTLMQFGTAAPRREQVEMTERVARICDMMRPSLSTPLDHVGSGPAPLLVKADSTQVMQVIVNLVINADQAIKAHGPRTRAHRITVSSAAVQFPANPPEADLGVLRAGHDYVSTTIADTGPGISDELRAKIFAPFVSGRADEGTGLGLAIVAHIVNAHQGALRIDNLPEGGTAITVYWPVTLSKAQQEPARLAQSALQPLAGLNVLLVDDDDQILQTLSDILTRAGAETVSCDNPMDAIAAILEDPDAWDVIVTDHDMTPITGLELAQELRQIAPKLKIVLVTGTPALQNATVTALDLQGAILRKPIAGPELVAVLLHEKLRDTRGDSKE